MRGKVGLVIGLAAGYVLGARAGRERYEQIKQQAQRFCDLPVVRAQTDKLKQAGKSAAMAVPTAMWHGAMSVVRAAGTRSSGKTPGERLDATVQAGKDSMESVADAAKKAADEAGKAADRAEKAANEAADTLRDRDGS